MEWAAHNQNLSTIPCELLEHILAVPRTDLTAIDAINLYSQIGLTRR